MTMTFRVIKPRSWAGNGFGDIPATYGVFVDGQQVGTISPKGSTTGGGGWFAQVGEARSHRYYYLRDAKEWARTKAETGH